jgi:hypothetical protein
MPPVSRRVFSALAATVLPTMRIHYRPMAPPPETSEPCLGQRPLRTTATC